MLKGYIKILLLFGVLTCGINGILAQEKLNVVTRKIEKVFHVQPGDKLIIGAERGVISISNWDKDSVKLELKISAKNQNLENARVEAKYMSYLLYQRRKDLTMRNYLQLPAGKSIAEVTSILRVEYDLWVPDDLVIDIQNKFGRVSIKEVQGEVFVGMEYGDLILRDVTAVVNVNINTGDLSCSNSLLNGFFQTRYSVLNFNNVQGNIKLNTRYGNSNIELNPNLNLQMESNKTEVRFQNINCHEFSLHLSGEYTPLKLKEDCYIRERQRLENDYSESGKLSNWRLMYTPDLNTPYIQVKSFFGSLELE